MPSILVVEDNPTARKMLRLALQAEGYAVIEAFDGVTALAQATAEAPDLIVQDLILPDMDGLDLLRSLRSLPGGAARPIIALSGFQSLIEKANRLFGSPDTAAAGFTRALMKPIEPSRLVEIIAGYLPPPASHAPAVGRGRRILVVDDDPIQLRLMVLRLKQLGFEVIPTGDATAALRVATAHPPDVILSDVLMPGVDGFELCVRARQEVRLRQVPILLISAHYVDQADAALARQVGAHALLLRQEDIGALAREIMGAIDAGAQHFETPTPTGDRGPHWSRIEEQLKRQADANAALARRCALSAAQLSIVGGVADALSRSEDVDTVIRDVLVACLDAGGISKGAIYRKAQDGSLKPDQAVGFSPQQREDLPRCFGAPQLLDEICAAKMVIPSRSLEPSDVRALMVRAEAQAMVIIPLLSAGACVGGLLLASTTTEVGEEDLLAFGRAIAAYINQALGLARAFARLNGAAEVNRLLFSSLDIDETIGTIAMIGTQLGEHCEVELVHDGKQESWATANRDPGKEMLSRQMRREHGLTRSVVSPDSRIVTSAEAESEGRTKIFSALGIDAEMVVPLSVHGVPLGIMRIGSSAMDRRFEEADLKSADDLARRASVAIYNAQLYHEAQEANRAKDDFLATVSHELRTPLTSILLGAAKLIRNPSSPPADVARAVKLIDRNARAQGKLIEDLLDVSSIISGKLELQERLVDLGQIIGSAVQVVTPLAEAKGISIEVILEPNSELVLGDPARLQQVVWNLLTNAIKFTPGPGGIQVRSVHLGRSMEIRVVDAGQGIDSTFLPFVFDRFRQGDSSSSRTHGGLGLGLAIVKHLVELHGGSVHVESAGLGHGSTFTVSIPVPAVLHEPFQDVPMSALSRDESRLEGVRLLVVEDETDVRELIVDLLREYGAEVRSAESAEEAMKLLDEFQPAVLVSDLGMAQEDGYHFIQRVRRTSKIPALALTGYAGLEHRRMALDAGFQMHMSKPVQPAALLNAVSDLAARNRSRHLRTS